MKVQVFAETKAMGQAAAAHATQVLNQVIARGEQPRLLLSTGASQFPFFDAFVKENVDWSKVEMFHLDEYVGISPDHPASFKKYLLERFVNVVNPGKYHLINGLADPGETIAELTSLLSERPVDLGLIGIGLGVFFAINYGAEVGAMLPIDQQYASISGFVVILIATLIIVVLLSKLITGTLSLIKLKWLNTLLGILFSVFKGLLVLSLLYAAIFALNARLYIIEPAQFDNSISFNIVRKAADPLLDYWEKTKPIEKFTNPEAE